MKHKIVKQKDVPVYHVVQQFLNARQDKKECARTAALMKYKVTGPILSQSLESLFMQYFPRNTDNGYARS